MRKRLQKEREDQQEARVEAKRREREQEKRRKQEARRQEDMLQQEMVRLRRQMEEKRCLQQLARQRYGFHGNQWPLMNTPLYLKLLPISSLIALCVILDYPP